MQQTKSYWRVVAVAGVVGAFAASACVVTTSTDDNTAGSSGTGATSSGGSSTTGGTSSTGGTTSAGGSSGSTSMGGTSSGGTGGTGPAVTPFQCDPPDGKPVGTPAVCASTGNACTVCTFTNCKTDCGNCFATSPGNQCGYGGPNGDNKGEFACIQQCVIDATSDGGVPDDTTVGTCTNGCVTPKDSSGTACSAVIGAQTSDFVGCLRQFCQQDCFGG